MTYDEQKVTVHKDSENYWSCDPEEMSFEGLLTLLRDVFNYSEKPPKVLRVSNVIFTGKDLNYPTALLQGYKYIQWTR